jgi:hypothetical protein
MRDEWEELASRLRAFALSRYAQLASSVTLHFPGGDRITMPLACAAPPPAEASGRNGWASGPEPKHLSDYRQVYWPGLGVYRFSPKQAVVIHELWSARFGSDNPDVAQAALLQNAESDCAKLSDLFRSNGKAHPAWGTFVVPGETPGVYRLPDLAGE